MLNDGILVALGIRVSSLFHYGDMHEKNEKLKKIISTRFPPWISRYIYIERERTWTIDKSYLVHESFLLKPDACFLFIKKTKNEFFKY